MKASSIVSKINASAVDLVSLASASIAIASPTGQEGEMARHVAEMLAQWGLVVETFELDPGVLAKKYPREFLPYNFPYEGRPNVLGKLNGVGGGRSLMINFHLDVVGADPAVWKMDPWKGTVKDGLLFGRGSADMKGGMAAALFAVKSIVEAKIRLKGDLIVAGVIEEEGPGNGTLALQAHGVSADACIIPEPTNLELCVALTGGIYGFVNVVGRSSHSTTPWEGVNALEKAYCLAQGIETWREKRRAVALNPLFAHSPETPAASHLINIARTDGGNIGRVPASAQMAIRSTVMPGEDPRELAMAMEETLVAAAVKDPWLAQNKPAFSWLILGGRSYPAELPADHPLCRELGKSFEKITGKPPRVSGFVSPADMQQLINIEPKTPTLMFGPGSLRSAHSDAEAVSISDLVTASAVIADFIIKWCGTA